jgi:NADH:ubiquinone oxidoreductase subunit 6 (subunit J)
MLLNFNFFTIEEILCVILALNFFFSATGVLFFRNPINAVVSLVFLFINGAFLLVMHYAEFFAILYLLIYVGAIVIFFLFVVMLLDLKKLPELYPNVSHFFILFILGFVFIFLLFSPILFSLDLTILFPDFKLVSTFN